MDRRETRKKIFDHFGLENQLDKLTEELYELIEALQDAACQYKGRTEKILRNPLVADEAGDVLVLLKQLLENDETFSAMVADSMYRKEKRTLHRMKNGYYDKREVRGLL